MYDFAGWFGSHPSNHSPNNILDTILDTSAERRSGSKFALGTACGHVGESGDISCLIAGDPRWKGYELKAMAAREGEGAVFARLYGEEGKRALARLTGSFAVAVYDRRKNEGLLAIDRMGICPLAYAEIPGGVVFSGDLQILRRHPSLSAEIDPQALFAYLYFHMIPAPLSVYRGMRKLLPAQYVLWRTSGCESGFYWHPGFDDASEAETKLAQRLQSTLQKAVGNCIDPTQTTGAFLSGGLDSSTITGLFRQLSPEQATTFSIGFAAEGYDEMEFARASARHFGVPLHEYYVTPQDVTAAVPIISACYDEPFGNASAVPTYFCAKLAKEHGSNTLLAGDGGDELFAGNERYAKQKMFALYDQIPFWLRSILIEPLASIGGNFPVLGKLKSYVDQAKIPMPERMETYNFLHRTPLRDIFDDGFLASINEDWPIEHLRHIYRRLDTPSMLKRMLWLDWKITLADNDLRKVNRMCALGGVKVFYPMLDEAVVDLASRIPDPLLMRGFELRSFYRHTFRDFLAPETLKKSKHGFGLPFGLWLKTDRQLQSLAYDSLNCPHLDGILRKDYLDRLKSAHLQDHASYYGTMIWVLMMWNQWMEQHHG